MVMARFFWEEREGYKAEDRYLESVPGREAWRELVKDVSGSPREDYSDVFAKFLAKLDGLQRPDPPTCCLFVSHRGSDVKDALHIAELATKARYDIWLDI